MKIELKPCVMCGSEHRDLMGYDYHKVSCSNEECPISYLALTKDEWNQRVETEAEKRLIAIATKHATRADELYEALNEVVSTGSGFIKARKVLNKSQKESDGE